MRKRETKNQYRINNAIRASEVRLVGDKANSTIDSPIVTLLKAKQMAEQQGLDLVEISPNATPPVCRLIDYSKFLYQQKKRQKELKANQIKVDVKEIRFGPQTDEHDYDFKLKHAQEFLTSGDKVKAYVFFRGRSILFKEQGELLLLRFANDLEEFGKVEKMPVLEGKRMILFLAPKKVKILTKADKMRQLAAKKKKEETEVEAPKSTKRTVKEYKGPRVEGE